MGLMDVYGAAFKPITGSEDATIDDKGRVVVAKKKRDRIGENFTLAFSSKSCLVLYPQFVWNILLREVMSVPFTAPGADQYRHMMLGESFDDMNFDGQGRFVIPQRMRERGKLKDKIVLVGCGDYVELWAEDQLDIYRDDPEGYEPQRREAMDRAYRRMKGLEV